MEIITIALIILGAGVLIGACSDKFHYKKKYGSWRAYFNSKPPSMSHVLHDNDGYYVCWDHSLHSEAEARQVAKRWTQLYG